jgi:predicted tellurium resistance membrane protein TerC
MVIAVVISILFMIFYASKISDIIDRYPSLEILALCFLILIGFTLILEAAHIDIPKGFIYFSLFFTLGVELINIRFRRVSLRRIKIRK